MTTGKAARAGKGRAKAPANETPEQRFKRLAEPRVSRALKAIRAVGKLSGRAYKYTPAQADKIITALSEELLATRRAYETAGKDEAQTAFTLD